MPTIVIRERTDRSDKNVSFTLSDAKTGDHKVTYDRGKQYVVSNEMLEVMEHSHEGQHLMVLDRHSKEPGVEELPTPPSPETTSKIGELVGAFGKAKEKASA